MKQIWRHLIPSILSLAFVWLSTFFQYYFIYFLLFAANIFNVIWGEFSNEEIRKELKFFYQSSKGSFIKIINAIVLAGMVFWGLYFVDTRSVHLIGFSITTGILTGCFIVTLAHDLLHSRNKAETVLSVLLLVTCGIPHFAADHLCGHHRNIGLQKDATTARLNESFYLYFFKITWSRLKNSFFTQFGLPMQIRKKIFRINMGMLALSIAAWLMIWFLAENPVPVLCYFIIQGSVSYLLYELINYIQHYGLVRRNSEDAITLYQSWNCYYKYTNYILFLLPLHSLHHLPKGNRKIQNLKAGPKMPYLYFLMIALALVPPLWFRKMNALAVKNNNEHAA